MTCRFRGRDRGFTSTELMFVVVVLGILVVVAVSSFFAATSKAELAACRANIRVLEDAVMAYQAANEGALPASLDDIDEYIIAPNVFDRCPGTETDLQYDPSTGRVTCPNHP